MGDWCLQLAGPMISTDAPREGPAQGQAGICLLRASCPGVRRSFWEHVLLKTRKLRFRQGKIFVCECQRECRP